MIVKLLINGSRLKKKMNYLLIFKLILKVNFPRYKVVFLINGFLDTFWDISEEYQLIRR